MSRDPGWRDSAAAGLCIEELRFSPPSGRALEVGDPTGAVAGALEAAGAEVSRWRRTAEGGRPADRWAPDGPFELACVRLDKDKSVVEMVLHAVLARLAPGGRVLLFGARDEGAKSGGARVEEITGPWRQLTVAKRCRLLEWRRPESEADFDPSALRGEADQWRVEGERLGRRWVSWPGVFGGAATDPGTALLLEHLPVPRGPVLDFGAGSGVLAAGMMAAHPDLEPDQVILVEPDGLAARACAENLPGTRVSNRAGWPAGVEVGTVISNPPYHTGKVQTLEVVEELVDGAARDLAPEGELRIVVQRRLPVEAALRARFETVEIVADRGPHRVWSARRGSRTSPRDRTGSPVRKLIVGGLMTLGAVACSGEAPADSGFSRTATILHENCASCHRDAGPAPFPLLTYEDAKPWAAQIANSVREGRMPPWLPADRGIDFEGERRLTDEEKQAILAWVEAGAPEGDPARHPDPPVWPSGWQLGEPDLVLTMDESYPVPATGPDQFRNFVLPVPVTEDRWVRAVEMRPSDPSVVHHATMRVDPTTSSRLEDARDSMPGFDEMFSRTEARPPGGFFLGWTPGKVPRENPPGMAWTLSPGSDFVVQLHLRATGEPVDISTEVGLWFTDTPPERTPTVVRLGGQTMDIPAGDSAYVVEDEFTLPVDADAIGIYPHAHYLARHMEVWAELPDGSTTWLIEIPEWDFNWQDAYRYEEPVPLPAGTRLRMRYTFDNSASNPRNPNSPPERVVYGPASDNEMAELWLQVVTPRAVDLGTLQREMAAKDAADKLEGWRHLVAIDPENAWAQFGLGSIAQSSGELGEAVRRYRLALEASPDLAQAQFNLGLIAEEAGEMATAEARYRDAVRILPDYTAAWNNLGRIFAARGDHDAAVEAFEAATEADPRNAEALVNLGTALREAGDPERSAEVLRRAVEAGPARAEGQLSLAVTLAELGQVQAALTALNSGLARDGGKVAAALEVAWTLATHPDPARRAPEVAGGLAAQIREATGPRARVLDVEAAAYAAAGRFDRAIALAEEALRAAAAETGVDAGAIRARLEGYRAGRAFVRGG